MDIPRENWDTWDPMLISEGLFSAANIFRSAKKNICNHIMNNFSKRTDK